MLDLNVNGSAWEVSVDSICDETSDHQLLLTTKPRRQDSGTSISSVVNVVDESPAVSVGGETGDSGSNLPGAILDRGNCGEASYARSIELVTRELFPVSKGEMEKMSCEIESQWLNLSVSESVAGDSSNKVMEDQPLPPPVTRLKKSRRGPRSRSSQYRGVTFYRRTGRWESHIWDCGKQVYLGGFDTAHAAARAYDRAALKFRGASADINFTASDYEDDLKQTKDLTKIEFVHILRRQSNGLSRGSSKYRGVTLYKNSQWGTQMDQFLGKKDCNEAAAVACIGPIAQTNLVPIWDRNTSLANRNQEAADTHHNLDLSLGITPLSSVKGGNNSVRSLHLHDASYHLSVAKRTKAAESFVPAPTGRQTPHYIPSWSGNDSAMAPNCEETAMKNMQPQVVPSHGVSNWAWQRNSQGMAIPLPSSSRAASSGFSPTTMWEFQPPSYH